MKFVNVLAVLILSTALLSADEVVLKNGNHLTGSIVKLDDNKLVLRTDFADTINIKWDAVSSFSTQQPLFIQTADKKIGVTGLTREGGSVELNSTTGQPVTLAAADIKGLRSGPEEETYERSLRPGLLEGWAGGGNVGLSLARGNSETLSVSTGMNLARTTLTDKLTLHATTVYTKDDLLNAVSADNIQAGARYDHNLGKTIFVYIGSDFEYDKLQNLDLRAVPDGGLGWHVIARPRTALDVLAGASLIHETYGTGLTNNIFSPSVGETLTQKLAANTVFKEAVFIFPYVSGGYAGNYRFTFDGALSTKISRWLAWQTTIGDHYVSNPLTGTKGNDLLLSTGLGVTFAGKK